MLINLRCKVTSQFTKAKLKTSPPGILGEKHPYIVWHCPSPVLSAVLCGCKMCVWSVSSAWGTGLVLPGALPSSGFNTPEVIA